VQVGLKDNSDEKSIYQDHYNHFLYELQRSKFGPLPECTLIIAYQAEIGAYFQKETKPLKKQKDRLVFVPTILNNMLKDTRSKTPILVSSVIIACRYPPQGFSAHGKGRVKISIYAETAYILALTSRNELPIFLDQTLAHSSNKPIGNKRAENSRNISLLSGLRYLEKLTCIQPSERLAILSFKAFLRSNLN
jgi:hypothetical protein